MQYSIVQYSTVEYYSTVKYSIVQYYNTVKYSAVQYSTVQYSTVQHSTAQYSVVAVLTNGPVVGEPEQQLMCGSPDYHRRLLQGPPSGALGGKRRRYSRCKKPHKNQLFIFCLCTCTYVGF